MRCSIEITHMRRPLLAAAAIAVWSLAVASEARAAGGIVTSPQRASDITEARVVMSSAGGRTTRWTQVKVEGTAGAFAWMLPVRPGAAVDVSSDAWIEALDLATSPRILTPPATPSCKMQTSPEMIGRVDRIPTKPFWDNALAANRTELDAHLAEWGIPMPAWMGPRVDGLYATGWQLVLLLHPGSSSGTLTRTVRVIDDGAFALPLVLTHSGRAALGVTAVVIGEGRAKIGHLPAATIDRTSLVWNTSGTTNYVGVRETTLLGSPSHWMLESAGREAVFVGHPMPRGYPALPSLVDVYYDRAQMYGDSNESGAACAGRAQAALARGPIGVACARGDLMNVPPVPTCTEVPASSPSSPQPFRCGNNGHDVAFALAGLDPRTAWITRAYGVIAADAFGENVPVSIEKEATISPAVPAHRYATCSDAGGFTQPGSGTPVGSRPGSGSGSGAVDPPVVSSGCGGSTSSSSSSDSCSSDSSGSYDSSSSSSDSCGSDSSSSSSSSSDDCDSSSSSSSSGDDCDSGGDSSADDCDSGSGGDDCSSGSGSDGCSSGGGADDCAVAKKAKKGRSQVSRWALGLVAFAFLIRRRLRLRAEARAKMEE